MFAKEPPLLLSVWCKLAINCYVTPGCKELIRRNVDITNKAFPLFEKRAETQWRDLIAYKDKVKAENAWAQKQVHRERVLRADSVMRDPPFPGGEFDSRLRAMDAAELFRAEVQDAWGLDTDKDLDFVLDQVEDRLVQEAGGSKETYLTQQLQRFREQLRIEYKAYEAGQVAEEEYKAVVATCCEPSITSAGGAFLGFLGVLTKETIESRSSTRIRKFKEKASIATAERKMMAQRLKQMGFFLARDPVNLVHKLFVAYNAGYLQGICVEESPHSSYEFIVPTTCEKLFFTCGMLCDFDIFDGELYGHYNSKGCLIRLAIDEEWHCSRDSKLAFFFATDDDTRIELLEITVCHQYPKLLGRDMMLFAGETTRYRLYANYLDGNNLHASVIEELAAQVQLRQEIFQPNMVVNEEELRKEHRAHLANMQQRGLAGPGLDMPHGEHKRKAGTTRMLPSIVIAFYVIANDEYKLVATARSHRVNEGAEPDRVRLTWAPGHTPSKSPCNPEVSTAFDLVVELGRKFLPMIEREFEAELSKVRIEKMDTFLDVVGEYFGGPERQLVHTMQTKGGKKALEKLDAEIIKLREQNNKSKPSMKRAAQQEEKLQSGVSS
eukprot:g16954.t1